MNKKISCLALTAGLLLALASPAFAQNMKYVTSYEMDGTIERKEQADHACNTGEELKQSITGEDKMTKVVEIELENQAAGPEWPKEPGDPGYIEPITDLLPPQWRPYRDFIILEGLPKLFKIDGLKKIPYVGDRLFNFWGNIYDNHIRPPQTHEEWKERTGR